LKPAVVLQELTTDSSGRYSRAVAPPREARFSASVQNVTSGTYVLTVSRRIASHSPAGGSRPQNPVLFEGKISPAQPELQVDFSRWDTDRWVYIGRAHSDDEGNYAVRLRLPSGGLTVRTDTSASGGNAYGEQLARIFVPA